MKYIKVVVIIAFLPVHSMASFDQATLNHFCATLNKIVPEAVKSGNTHNFTPLEPSALKAAAYILLGTRNNYDIALLKSAEQAQKDPLYQSMVTIFKHCGASEIAQKAADYMMSKNKSLKELFLLELDQHVITQSALTYNNFVKQLNLFSDTQERAEAEQWYHTLVLLQSALEPDSLFEQGKTLLMTVIEWMHQSTFLSKSQVHVLLKFIQFLLTHHKNINARDSLGNTTLMYASTLTNPWLIKKSNSLIVDMLLRYPLDINIKNNKGENVLFYMLTHAPSTGQYNKYVEDIFAHNTDKFIAKNIDINAVDNNGKSLLQEAVEHMDTRLIKRLLQSNANPNIQDNAGNTPLIWAVQEAEEELQDGGPGSQFFKFYVAIIELLIKSGARVDLVNNQGKTLYNFITSQTLMNALHGVMISPED